MLSKHQVLDILEAQPWECNLISGLQIQRVSEARNLLVVFCAKELENSYFSDLLNLISNHKFLIDRSTATAIYSILIALEVGYTSGQVFQILSVAGLFHDIGLTEMDQSICQLPLDKLTAEEKSLYLTHPARGQEALRQFPDMSNGVLQLVLEHHEDQSESGFPMSASKFSQHPLSEVFQLACLISELSFGNSEIKGSPIAFANYIEQTPIERIGLKPLLALRRLLCGHS